MFKPGEEKTIVQRRKTDFGSILFALLLESVDDARIKTKIKARRT